MVRRSPRPSKQLLWLLLQRDMKHSQSREVGVDVGCGKMGNYSLFQTQRYIGVDIDQTSLDLGRKTYPRAESVCAPMEQATHVKGDFLLCVQVFNNIHFDVNRTMDAVGALCAMVNPKGTLIFNIGKDSKKYEEEINVLLSSKFESVEKIRYGSAFSTRQRPMIGSLIFALAMLKITSLREIGGYQKVYYLCTNRRG